MVANVVGVEGIEETKWAVVYGQTQGRHIVGIEHTMTKAHALPSRHQFGAALADGGEHGQIRIVGL